MSDFYKTSEKIITLLEFKKQDLVNVTEESLSGFIDQLKDARQEYKIIKIHAYKDYIKSNCDVKLVKIKNRIKEIKAILKERKAQINVNNIQPHPFKDNETFDFFKYIVKKWNYNYNQKWSDIWNELDYSEKYKAPYKNEYEAFIILSYNYTGKFQYDKVKKDDNKNKILLLEIIKEFSKNRPI